MAWIGHRGSLSCMPKGSSISVKNVVLQGIEAQNSGKCRCCNNDKYLPVSSEDLLGEARTGAISGASVLVKDGTRPHQIFVSRQECSADEISICIPSRGNTLTVVPGGNRRRHKISRATAVT
jgi:hypothetical protein